MEKDTVVFNGITFRRYPNSPNLSDRRYFTPGTADRQRGIGRLHQEVYKHHHGPIPYGHHVHHADGDSLNNEPSNLVAVPGKEHVSNHSREWKRANETSVRQHMENIRPLAAAWHRSEEGRTWHREHGKRTWGIREPVAKECEVCGQRFEDATLGKRSRFCSNRCKAKWRRDSGVDDVQRTCTVCGDPFTINKYGKQRTCSRACSGKAGGAKRRKR